MTVRTLCRLVAVVLAITVVQPLSAQFPQKFENLQVFPKDIHPDTLNRIMRGFTMALSVRCQFCHVEREGAPAGGGSGGGLNFDFFKDDKDNKKIARLMLRMADSINTRFLASIPNRDDPPTNVTCMTCHRGLSTPGTIETVLLRTTARAGVDSAIARYRVLRNEMATGRYNFTEQPVSEVARSLAQQGRHADAVKLLEMLQEFYPNSVNIDYQIAELHLAGGNRDQGIARLRAVLAKNPNDRRAQQRLQQLGVQP
ncbi:MAG: c-type cytochrome [Gemmatimonadaceae bacterium]